VEAATGETKQAAQGKNQKKKIKRRIKPKYFFSPAFFFFIFSF